MTQGVPAKITAAQWRKAARLYEKGESSKALSRMFGCSCERVRTELAKLGVGLRNDRTVWSLVPGARFGPFEILRCLTLGEDLNVNDHLFELRCTLCGALHRRLGAGVYQERHRTSCLKCRWKVHAIEARCRDCGRSITRATADRKFVCGKCQAKNAIKRMLERRCLRLGRTCVTCGRDDSQTRFMTRTSCEACQRAAQRNGRCSCGRAIRKGRGRSLSILPCACGAVA